MVSTCVIFIFVGLFLVISSVPIDEVPNTTEVTEIPDVVTDNLLFISATVVPMDENIETGNSLLYKKDGDVPDFPSTQDPRLFQINFTDANVTEQTQFS